MKRRFSRVAAYLLPPCAIAIMATLPDIPVVYPVQQYVDGQTRLYSDRPYVNHLLSGYFDSTHVVQLPRHLPFAVTLECKSPCTVYRLLSEANDNSPFSGWENAGIRIDVPRPSGALTYAVSRDFGPGTYRLPSGGPAASSPILVRTKGEVAASGISSKNKLVSYSEAGGFLDFIGINILKLGAVCLLIVANFFLVRRWFEAS